MAQATETKTTTAVADPAPLGLMGFATTTLVLSAGNSGFSGVTAGGALSLALAYGGLAQLLAGMWEFKNGNTFGAVAFSSYGAFWLSFWAFFNIGGSAPKGTYDVAWYLLGWTVVTGVLLIGTFRLNYGLVVVFALLFITFLLLCIGAFNGQAAGNGLTGVGGYVGIATAVAAFYMALAGILKAVSGGSINLPVGPIKR
jgi:succinate-acetate transporter protein